MGFQEVAPTKEKSAFWSKDIKVARELNKGEKPPPVNVSILRQGVKDALNQGSDVPIDSIRFKVSPRRGRMQRNGSLETLLALESHERKANEAGLLGPLWDYSTHGRAPATEDDNVRYVGLEDMGRLLGFADEDDDFDHAAVGRKIGRGRYI